MKEGGLVGGFAARSLLPEAIAARRLTRDPVENSIELGERLKARGETRFADVRVGVEQQLFYRFDPGASEIFGEAEARLFFEKFAEIKGAHVHGACDLAQTQVVALVLCDEGACFR